MNREVSACRLLLIFYYHRINRYSFNALAGALDRSSLLADLPVVIAFTADQLGCAVADAVHHYRNVVVALSIMTCQFRETRRVTAQLRQAYGPRITIVAGGAHPTAGAGEVLDLGVDIVCCGESEMSFPRVLERLIQEEEFHDVPGIAFMKNGKFVTRRQTQAVNIDEFFSFSPKRDMFGPIEITRGCPFACSYCQTSHVFGTRLRHRSIDNITRQAASLRSRDRRVVRLLSSNAFSYGSFDGRRVNIKALRDLLASLRETVSAKGRIIFGHFPSEVRPEHVTPETLSLLREFADNDEIVIGAQSGSRRMLDLCHRSHTVEDILTAVTLSRKYGFKTIVDFIFGLPDEEETDMRETLDLIGRLTNLGARIHPHIFAPLPQTNFSGRPPGFIRPAVTQALEELKARRLIYQIRPGVPAHHTEKL